MDIEGCVRMSSKEIMVAKNRVNVTRKRKTDCMDIEITISIGLGDGLDRKRDIEENGLSKWINGDAIYFETE